MRNSVSNRRVIPAHTVRSAAARQVDHRRRRARSPCPVVQSPAGNGWDAIATLRLRHEYGIQSTRTRRAARSVRALAPTESKADIA